MIKHPPSDLVLIFNTSPLIVLSELSILDLLIALAQRIRIIIPDSVLNELIKNMPSELRKFEFKLEDIPEEESRFQIFLEGLDPGEQGALKLILWMRRNRKRDIIFVTDDKRARKIAKKLGIKVFGTLGLIELFKKSGLISIERALELINNVPSTSLYITQKLIDEAMRKILQQRRKR